MDSNKRIPLSDLVDCAVIFTPEDLKEDIELPKRFTFSFCAASKKREIVEKFKMQKRIEKEYAKHLTDKLRMEEQIEKEIRRK